MTSPANVTAIDALVDFKNALCTFASKASDAVGSVDMQTQRLYDWLDDQIQLWKKHVRKCEDGVIQAQRELRQRKMFLSKDRRPDCPEQEMALRRAKMHLAEAENRLHKTKTWRRKVPELVDQFGGPIRRLRDFLDTQYPKADARLQHAIASLEDYLRIQSEGG